MCKHWAVRWAFRYSWSLIALLLLTGVCYSDTTWTGAGPDGNWSTGGNWTGGVPPIGTDVVTFGAAGSGSPDIVDTDFTISGLQYIGNGIHSTNLNSTSNLQINGPVYVGVGAPTNGANVTWTSGGNVTVGSSGALQNFGIGINNAVSSTGTTSGSLFLEDIAVSASLNDLSIGYKIDTAFNSSASNAAGSLILGSNSTLVVGTPSARANLTIGGNANTQGTVTGLLDARQGTIDLHLTNLNVGYTSQGGAATGTMTMGSGSAVNATTVNIGSGTNATGTFNLTGGLLIAQTINVGAADVFNFTGGRLAVGTFNNTLNPEGLNQQGGTLAPGNTSPGRTTVNGNYNLWSPGTLEIQLLGLTPGSLFDQVRVNGLVNLNADLGTGGMLDTILGFGPNLGDSFLILDNDGTDAISGFFSGLVEGATFTEAFGGTVFTFGITYLGGHRK